MKDELYPFLNFDYDSLRIIQDIFLKLINTIRSRLRYYSVIKDRIYKAKNLDSLFTYIIEEIVFEDEIVHFHTLIELLKLEDVAPLHDGIGNIIITSLMMHAGYINYVRFEVIPDNKEDNTVENEPLSGPPYPIENDESMSSLIQPFLSCCGES